MGTAIGTGVYFLAFLLSASAAFLGLPLPGTLPSMSSTDASYNASAVTDLMPNLCIRIFTALISIFNSLAMSLMVKKSPFSFMLKLSENVSKSLILLNVCIVKFCKKKIFFCDFSILFT